MGTVARNFNVGLELHETGLNLLSSEIFQQHPEWFTRTRQIPIDTATGRMLVLDVRVTEPISFNFSPIASRPETTNELVAQAKVRFVLSDLPAGGLPAVITTVQATLQAVASVQFANQLISLFLESFHVLDMTPADPATAPSLSGGTLGFQPSLVQYAATTPAPTDDAFVAILNYLIAVFLQDGLEEPIVQFPVPQLQTLPVIQLPVFVRGLGIFSDRLGVYLRHVDGPLEPPTGPLATPAVPEPHISIGVVSDSIQQVLSRVLPVTVPVQYGDATRFFEVLPGSSLTVLNTSTISLEAPDTIRVVVRFQGRLNMQINVALGNYTVHAPLALPIGPPSHFDMPWNAFARQTDDGLVHILIRPTPNFIDSAEVEILPDWRNVLKAAVHAWLLANVVPVLVKIPVIGWVIAKTADAVISELAGVFGAIIDGLEGGILTLAGNLMIQTVSAWLGKVLEFEVYHFNAVLPIPGIQLKIASFGPLEIADNAGGELVLHCWLNDQGIVVPEPPVPPAPIPDQPATPGSPSLPSYPPGEFAPAFGLNAPVWSDGDEYIYDVVLQRQGLTLDYVRTVTMSSLTGPKRWQIDSQLADSQGNLVSRSTAILDAVSHLPMSESGWTKDGQSGLTVTSSVVFDYIGGTAQATVQVGTFPTTGTTVPLDAGISLVSSEEWMFELMTAPLAAGNSGKLARVDLQPGSSAANWGRLIPIAMQAAADQVAWQGNNVQSVKVQAHDESVTSTIWVGADASRLILVGQQQTTTGQLTFTLRPSLRPAPARGAKPVVS